MRTVIDVSSAHELPDHELVAQFAASDPAGTAAFVGRFRCRVIGLALTIIGDPAAAEDAAQEAFLKAWRHASVFGRPVVLLAQSDDEEDATAMPTISSRSRAARTGFVAALVALGALGLAACGGGTQSASSYGLAPSTAGKRATEVALGTATNAALARAILVDRSGRTVYLFVPDGLSSTSTVPDAIQGNWPPVVAGTTLRSGAGVQADAVSVQTRPDGTRQLAYAGHLLYTFVGDAHAGDVNGQGFTNKWYVVSPSGSPVTRTTLEATLDAGTAHATPSTATTPTTPTTKASHGRDGDAANRG